MKAFVEIQYSEFEQVAKFSFALPVTVANSRPKPVIQIQQVFNDVSQSMI
jgi:hypothetical protein